MREERKKAKKNKDKYIGLSSEAMGYKGSGNTRYALVSFNNNYNCFLLGTEKWDETPRWKKDSNNEFSDKKSSNTLGFEESPNNRYKS